jgi:2'-5' RNA ligase
MASYGVFFIPDKNLVEEINSLKNYFNLKSSKNKYIKHPVHTSFYVFNAEKEKEIKIINSFSSLNSKLKPVICKFDKWGIFENDFLADGLNTLYLAIEKKTNLFEIQKKVVEELSKFHLKESTYFNFGKDFMISKEKYGYPFVGNHWIPHITIGGLDIKPQEINKLINRFELSHDRILVNSLNLYLIEKDEHHLIKKIDFE